MCVNGRSAVDGERMMDKRARAGPLCNLWRYTDTVHVHYCIRLVLYTFIHIMCIYILKDTRAYEVYLLVACISTRPGGSASIPVASSAGCTAVFFLLCRPCSADNGVEMCL